MLITFLGIVDDINEYEGKNGWGANVTFSHLTQDKKRKSIQVIIKDKTIFHYLEDKLQEEVQVEMYLVDSKFGLRFGDVVNVS